MRIVKISAVIVSLVFLTACSESGTSENVVTNSTNLNSNALENSAVSETTTETTLNSNALENSAVSETTTETTQNSNALDNSAVSETTTETSTEVLPVEPEGLRGVVYTDTEIEIFWNSSSDTSIVNYTVSRDGAVLSTIDALSYYDNTVVSGTTYEYTLQSVDNNDVHSNPVSLFLTTPVRTPTINATNALALLEQVAAVTNGRLFAREFRDIYTATGQRISLIESGFELDSISGQPDGSTTRTYNCDQQGQLSITDNGNVFPSYRGDFQNCGSVFFDEESISGEYSLDRSRSDFVFDTLGSNHLRFDTIVTTDSDNNSRTLTGLFEIFDGGLSRSAFGGYEQTVFGDDGIAEVDGNGNVIRIPKPFHYVSQAFEGETRVELEDVTRSRGSVQSQNTQNTGVSNEWTHSLFAEFTLQSPGTGNKLISVTTPEALHTNVRGGCFEQGQLKITAADGSELLLDANNGHPSTATLHVTADGVMSQETIEWSSEILLFHATPNDVYGQRSFPIDNLPTPGDCTGS